ncbi:MAG: hypothetical protein ACETVZ_04370, partial [Phycisphaerae bacterium]
MQVIQLACVFGFSVSALFVPRAATDDGRSGSTELVEVIEHPGSRVPARRGPRAAVYFSDGKVLTGKISLTPGRSFKLNIPKAGKLKTT